ncbi:MAG: class I SAM-dependent methyltransferase [Acidimicrobiales bacterium]
MGRAGDFDYEANGPGYALRRRADPRIERLVHEALGSARSVVNVGAGAGSYEPETVAVTAVEPSATMRSQRPRGHGPAIEAVAEDLPFAEGSFDAAMAMVTVHQWYSPDRGLRELRRVSRGRIVILTFDGDALGGFWLAQYAPDLIEAERGRYPAIDRICALLGGGAMVTSVPIPIDCTDGFTEAYYARPELILERDLRASQSAWGFVTPEAGEQAVDRLRKDLESGRWDRQFGHLRGQPTYEGSLRLIITEKPG